MNNKRMCERIAAIASIIMNSLMLMGLLMMLMMLNGTLDPEFINELLDPSMSTGAYTATCAVLMVVSVGAIVVSALLLGKNRSKPVRLGLGIAMVVINGLYAIVYYLSLVLYFAVIETAIVVLEIVALASKETAAPRSTTRIVYMGDANTVYRSRGSTPPPDPFAPPPDPFDYDEKKSAASANGESIDSKLADLKRLRDTNVITEEQYRSAVDKLIRSEADKK